MRRSSRRRTPPARRSPQAEPARRGEAGRRGRTPVSPRLGSAAQGLSVGRRSSPGAARVPPTHRPSERRASRPDRQPGQGRVARASPSARASTRTKPPSPSSASTIQRRSWIPGIARQRIGSRSLSLAQEPLHGRSEQVAQRKREDVAGDAIAGRRVSGARHARLQRAVDRLAVPADTRGVQAGDE